VDYQPAKSVEADTHNEEMRALLMAFKDEKWLK